MLVYFEWFMKSDFDVCETSEKQILENVWFKWIVIAFIIELCSARQMIV
jgi:hypothetical protein